MMKVLRTIPITFLPYMFFSFHTPYACAAALSSSASSVNGRSNLSLNFACAELAGFYGAAGRIGPGIEIQHHAFALQRGQLELRAAIRAQRDIGSLIANLQHKFTPASA